MELADLITGALIALIATTVTVVLFILKPADKENAKREALHELELFCPPGFGSFLKADAMSTLSRIYKHLQYASRGRSFLVTRAAVWEMTRIVEGVDGSEISPKIARQLYIYKSIIAFALGQQRHRPLFARSAQRKYRGRLKRVIKQTHWMIREYNKMNEPKIEEFEKQLNEFQKSLLRKPDAR